MNKILEASIKSLENPGKFDKPLPKTSSTVPPILYVFRHGQTHDNIRRIFSGRRNSTLTEEGKKQAKILAEKLKDKHIDIAIYPPLSRAKNTLKEVLKFHPKIRIERDKSLMERDYGKLTGKSKIKLAKKDPVLAAKYRRGYNFPPPNGESLKDVKEKRIYPFCRKIEERMKKENVNVAISCTNNTMRLIRMYFEGLSIEEMQTLENPLAQDFCSYKI